MGNLNPMFTKKVRTDTKPRKVRADKIHDIKFPVTSKQRIFLRKLAKEKQAKHITAYATTLLIEALRLVKLNPGAFPEVKYKDTKEYIHVKPREREYDFIATLKIEWDLRSDRQTVHRLLMGMIYLLEDESMRNLL